MIVVQSWDDGVVDDVRLIGILRRHGAAATFNLNIGLNGPERQFGWTYKEKNKDVHRLALGEMVALYEGFEVASHSLKHPHLEQLAPEDLDREVAGSKRQMEAMFKRPVIGLCYPFGTFNDAVKAACQLR